MYNVMISYTYRLWKDFSDWINTPTTSQICLFSVCVYMCVWERKRDGEGEKERKHLGSAPLGNFNHTMQLNHFLVSIFTTNIGDALGKGMSHRNHSITRRRDSATCSSVQSVLVRKINYWTNIMKHNLTSDMRYI